MFASSVLLAVPVTFPIIVPAFKLLAYIVLYLFVLEPMSKVISVVGKIDCAVMFPANVPAPPTLTS